MFYAIAAVGQYLRLANVVTAFRVFLVLLVVFIAPPPQTVASGLLLAGLVCLAFLLDGVDGLLARRLGSVSLVGSFADIFADRIVEWTLWLHFFVLGSLEIWQIGILMIRTILVDVLRLRAFRMGRITPVGPRFSTEWCEWVVLSPWSRGGYASAKAALASILILTTVPDYASWTSSLLGFTIAAVLTLNLVRAAGIAFEFLRPLRLMPALASTSVRPDTPAMRGASVVYVANLVSDAALFLAFLRLV